MKKNYHLLLTLRQNDTIPLDDDLEISYKTKHSFTMQSSNLVENLLPHKNLHMDIYNILFLIAKTQMQPRCPSIGEWINWYNQKMECLFVLLPCGIWVPRPGIRSKPTGSDLHCSCCNTESSTHCARPGIKPSSQSSQDISDPVVPQQELWQWNAFNI